MPFQRQKIGMRSKQAVAISMSVPLTDSPKQSCVFTIRKCFLWKVSIMKVVKTSARVLMKLLKRKEETMKRPIDQALNFVSQDTIAALNEMVADGKFLMHLNMLEQFETTILSDDTGCFVNQSGEPRPGVFQTLRTLRVLKDDLRTLNALCPESPSEITDY